MIYIRKGDLLTCSEGHPIAEAACDIVAGAPLRVEDFTDWRIPAPRPEDKLADCNCHCSKPYLRPIWRDDTLLVEPCIWGEWVSEAV